MAGAPQSSAARIEAVTQQLLATEEQMRTLQRVLTTPYPIAQTPKENSRTALLPLLGASLADQHPRGGAAAVVDYRPAFARAIPSHQAAGELATLLRGLRDSFRGADVPASGAAREDLVVHCGSPEGS